MKLISWRRCISLQRLIGVVLGSETICQALIAFSGVEVELFAK